MAFQDNVFLRWFPGEINHDTGFHQIVSARIPTSGKILDLGCGDNDLMTRYRTPNREIWGTDFAAHPTLRNANWYRPLAPDGGIAFQDSTFNLVTSFMVLEHVDDPLRFFGEISRVLAPGGVFVGQSIHGLHYVTWIRRMFDLVPHSWVQRLVKKLYGRDEHDTFPTRYRLNSRRTIARAAQAVNLDVASWRAYASQGYFTFSPIFFRLAVVLDWTLGKVHDGLGKIYFTVVLQKPGSSDLTQRSMPWRRAT